MKLLSTLVLSLTAAIASAHYTFPNLIVDGTVTPDWEYVRETDNHYSNEPVTDVTSPAFRCYNTQNLNQPSTYSVAAGSTVGLQSNGNIYHQGVVNIYMARAPDGTNITNWDGSGDVWFKAYEITAKTDGGSTISFPAEGMAGVSFPLPKNLPSGQYLVRMEALALHAASTFGGAQWYISCAQINVTGGGSGTPGPLVSIPGVYTGNEPGILLNIYSPIPATYTQPGPAVWSG